MCECAGLSEYLPIEYGFATRTISTEWNIFDFGTYDTNHISVLDCGSRGWRACVYASRASIHCICTLTKQGKDRTETHPSELTSPSSVK